MRHWSYGERDRSDAGPLRSGWRRRGAQERHPQSCTNQERRAHAEREQLLGHHHERRRAAGPAALRDRRRTRKDRLGCEEQESCSAPGRTRTSAPANASFPPVPEVAATGRVDQLCPDEHPGGDERAGARRHERARGRRRSRRRPAHASPRTRVPRPRARTRGASRTRRPQPQPRPARDQPCDASGGSEEEEQWPAQGEEKERRGGVADQDVLEHVTREGRSRRVARRGEPPRA